MRVLVCGGRHFDDTALVETELDRLHGCVAITVVIHAGIPGLGLPAESWARRNGVHVIRYPANFTLGKRGDFMRDSFMLEDSRPAVLLAFPGGRRTRELLAEADERGIAIRLADSARQGRAIPEPA